jgi:universal stress protein A
MTIKTIVCCMDFSANAEAALAMAGEMALNYKAELEVLHVLPTPINPLLDDFDANVAFDSQMVSEETRQALTLKVEDRIRQICLSKINPNVTCRPVILNGHVSTEILGYLEQHPVDVVVLGAFGLSGMGLVIFGSVAKRVAHKAPCSVMIARNRTTPPAAAQPERDSA